MGIKGLAKLLSDEAPECIREIPLNSLHGRKIAVDASMQIYQFLIESIHWTNIHQLSSLSVKQEPPHLLENSVFWHCPSTHLARLYFLGLFSSYTLSYICHQILPRVFFIPLFMS